MKMNKTRVQTKQTDKLHPTELDIFFDDVSAGLGFFSLHFPSGHEESVSEASGDNQS